MNRIRSSILTALLTTVGLSTAGANPTFFGPTPYLQFADSPFLATGAFCPDFVLEDFERGGLTVPGVVPSHGQVLGPSPFTDSVDADVDGINGTGNNGHTWWTGFPGTSTSLTFTFTGTLPTAAGLVWTDSTAPTIDQISFEAFDAGNNSLGVIGPFVVGDGFDTGATAEDRFFGVLNAGGVKAIRLTMGASTNFEVDHIQWGCAVPEPGSLGALAVLAGIGLVRRRA